MVKQFKLIIPITTFLVRFVESGEITTDMLTK